MIQAHEDEDYGDDYYEEDGEEEQSNSDEDVDQTINPELIGASQALEDGDLEKYAAIMSGK